MKTFVVECYWPRMIEQEARETLDRLVGLDGEASPEPAILLGCILVPSDGMALLLFSALDEEMVTRISRLAELPFDRIVESVHIGFDC